MRVRLEMSKKKKKEAQVRTRAPVFSAGFDCVCVCVFVCNVNNRCSSTEEETFLSSYIRERESALYYIIPDNLALLGRRDSDFCFENNRRKTRVYN